MTEQPKAQATEQSRLAVLYELSSRLGTSLDLSEVLNQVMDSIIQLTRAERGFVMLYDELSGELKTMATRTSDEQAIDGRTIQISRTVIERAISTGKAIVTNNAQEDDRFSTQQSVVGYQLRSIMCAPLLARGRTLGAVYVDNRLFTGIFKNEDLELLATFANQAAISIENARLFTQTDQALARRVEELSLFQQIDRELNRSLDLNRVLSLALDWAVGLTNADGGSIGLLEQTEEEATVLRLLVSKNKETEETAEQALIPATHPILAQVLAEHRHVVLENATAEQSMNGRPAVRQISVPIEYSGNITGLITLHSQNSAELNRDDVAFVTRLADRAAVAIKNARLYQDIHAANKAKSDFVSLVTHELRLPLTSIKGYTDLLVMATQLTDQQKQFVTVVQRNLGRMSALISDLSDINRIESGRMKFEIKTCLLQDIVEDVTENVGKSIDGRQQTLTVEVPADLPQISADPGRINQILTNLLTNANKYTPDNGHITLHVSHDDQFAHVSIRDNGLGISEENQAKLFTQFFRAEDKAVRDQAGWGLGLSIVKKMVEAQGGQITFQSQLGVGSTFTFTIPLAKAEATP